MATSQQVKASPACATCGCPVTCAPTGRPRRYCSNRCKQKAARNRQILVEIITAANLSDPRAAREIDWSDEDHRVA